MASEGATYDPRNVNWKARGGAAQLAQVRLPAGGLGGARTTSPAQGGLTADKKSSESEPSCNAEGAIIN